jgi:hypothetical protein
MVNFLAAPMIPEADLLSALGGALLFFQEPCFVAMKPQLQW